MAVQKFGLDLPLNSVILESFQDLYIMDNRKFNVSL